MCIIGLVANGEVHIGGDSCITRGWFIKPSAWPKVFTSGAFLIGSTGSLRPSQILEHQLVVREKLLDESEAHYITVAFINGVRTCLREQGYATIDDNAEEGGTFLVGYNGGLYCVSRDYGVSRSLNKFAAIGCGEEYALGAMAALEGLDPEERIMKSLEIAARFSAGVCGPFVVLRGER